MFPVELQVVVSAKTHRDPLVLSTCIELPFAPFPGLNLYGIVEDADEPIEVESVAYDVVDRIFHCEIEDDTYSPEDEDGDTVLTIEDKLAEYGEGWDVKGADESDGEADDE